MAKARKNPAAAALGRKGGQVRSGLSERIVKQRCRRLHAESLAVVRVPGSLLSLVTGDRHLAVRYVSSFSFSSDASKTGRSFVTTCQTMSSSTPR